MYKTLLGGRLAYLGAPKSQRKFYFTRTRIAKLRLSYLGVSGLSAAGPPNKLRPLFGLFCVCLDNIEVPVPRGKASGEITAGSM